METKQKYFSPECEIVELRITQGMLSESMSTANPNRENPFAEGGDW